MSRPHALYRCFSETGGLLYVGCSGSPLKRLKEHEAGQAWATRIATVSLEWFESKAAALEAEKAAIASELPEWNVHNRPNPKKSIGVFHQQFNRDDPATWVQQ